MKALIILVMIIAASGRECPIKECIMIDGEFYCSCAADT